MSRRLQRSAITGVIAGAIGLGSFYIWSRECSIANKPEAMDSMINSDLYKRLNPVSNSAIYDRCTRMVDYSDIKTELLDDARRGGAKLMNAFTGGVWGSAGENGL